MRKAREVTVGIGVIAMTFLLALPVCFAVVWAWGSLTPGWFGLLASGYCLLWLAGRWLPPYLRWAHRLADVPFPSETASAGPVPAPLPRREAR